MIESWNIVKRHGNLEVLRSVDLNITQGEIASIVGFRWFDLQFCLKMFMSL